MRTHLTYIDRHGDHKPLEVSSVLYFESGQKYVTAHHEGGETLLNDTLVSLEAELHEFIRIHRSLLVRRSLVLWMIRKKYDKSGWLALKGVNRDLPVSRRRLSAVADFIASKENQA